MGLRVKVSAGGIQIDEGWYTAIVESIKEGKGDYGPYYIWMFSIKKPIVEGEEVQTKVTLSTLCSDRLSLKSKLGKFVKACGIDLEAAQESGEVDLEDCIGKTVRAYVEDDEKDDGAVYSKVTKLKVSKHAEPVAKKKPKDDDDDEEEPPKKKSESKKVKDDDDEEEAPKKKKKAKEEEDEDSDEEEPPKKKKAPKEEDDDEEEPPKKKKAPKDDDEDEDSPPPKKKSKEEPKKSKKDDEEDMQGLFKYDEDDEDE